MEKENKNEQKIIWKYIIAPNSQIWRKNIKLQKYVL